MTGSFLTTLGASFLGTLGFGVLLHAPRKSLILGSLLGALGYGIYWGIAQAGGSQGFAMFMGALGASLLAQVAARRMRMIATIFITLSIIPLVPGLGLYRCMSYLAQGQSALGVQEGVSAMTNILMIALGVSVGAFLYRARVRLRLNRKGSG